ncbi:hypothetical protein FACS189418_5570 [Clostridia bacterium]|nr:hypothetical protein FACS189418_5570 [Clostridia bacterium]
MFLDDMVLSLRLQEKQKKLQHLFFHLPKTLFNGNQFYTFTKQEILNSFFIPLPDDIVLSQQANPLSQIVLEEVKQYSDYQITKENLLFSFVRHGYRSGDFNVKKQRNKQKENINILLPTFYGFEEESFALDNNLAFYFDGKYLYKKQIFYLYFVNFILQKQFFTAIFQCPFSLYDFWRPIFQDITQSITLIP